MNLLFAVFSLSDECIDPRCRAYAFIDQTRWAADCVPFLLKWSAKRVVDMFKDIENTTNTSSLCVSVLCVELNWCILFYVLIELF